MKGSRGRGVCASFNIKLGFPAVFVFCFLFFFAGFFGQTLFLSSNISAGVHRSRLLEQVDEEGEIGSAQPSGETGESSISSIPFQVLSWKPRALYFPKFATAEQCQSIISTAKSNLLPSTLALRKGETEENTKGIRTSSGTFVSASEDKTGTLEIIEKKIARATMLPRSHGEAFNVLRYEIGQKYNSHYDAFNPSEYGPQKSQRIASFLLYLSDVEEGGETMFPFENGVNTDGSYDYKKCIGLRVKPRQGDGLLFYSLFPNGTIDPIDESSPAPKKDEFREDSSGSLPTLKVEVVGDALVFDSSIKERSFEESLGSMPVVKKEETGPDSPKGECSANKSHGSISTADKKECKIEESPGSGTTGKTGKKKERSAEKSSGYGSTLKSGKNSVNKISSQIKKPPHRRSASPLNWFPRKKTDSFMKRKIRFLQEVGGMNATLDETLGDSNPHYCRVEREKIAAREAARKAMETRKAAMVEASWCRILRAARIPCKEAESRLIKAEESVTEAFAEAAAMDVIMYDKADCPRQACEIETSSAVGGGSTHRVTASFETAFEVDKEVAAAVKTAFIRLANCPSSSNKDEFQDLLRKISQNPDKTEQELSECESDHGPELQQESCGDHFGTNDVKIEVPEMESRPRTYRNKKLPSNSTAKGPNSSIKLVDMMLDRLKQLHEDELASLATIVATCGLNAALREAESNKQIDPDSIADYSVGLPVPLTRAGSRRESNFAYFTDGKTKSKQSAMEVPSLDKFLVKHVSRLEREVQEAKNSRKNNIVVENRRSMESSDAKVSESSVTNLRHVPDLGSILVKHTSRLEKEIEEAKKSRRAFEKEHKDFKGAKDIMSSVPDQVGKENINTISISALSDAAVPGSMLSYGKNSSRGKCMSRIERAKVESLKAFSAQDVEDNNGLDKVLVKSVHRLEREKVRALAVAKDNTIQRDTKNPGRVTTSESLDKVLVKHVSRLEKEKMACRTDETMIPKKDNPLEKSEERSLEKVLLKHQSVLEKEKSGTAQQFTDHTKPSETRRQARERELQEAWQGLSLGNSIKPHVSRLEREKAAWKRAEEEERRQLGTSLVARHDCNN